MASRVPTVVFATAADLDAIDAISLHSFTAPWPRQTFADELTRPHGRLAVARDDAAVIGFVNYWLVADEVHLPAIAVDPDQRSRGVGAVLLAHVVDAARDARVITLEVRASNTPAIALYRRAGFVTVATRTGYYGGDGEDALVMLRER